MVCNDNPVLCVIYHNLAPDWKKSIFIDRLNGVFFILIFLKVKVRPRLF